LTVSCPLLKRLFVLDTYEGEVTMVRNLMMIVGLSLAVAAFGCSDDEGTGGSGGTAGSGGSGGTTPTGACTNTADTAVVCGAGFDDAVSTCALDALGQGPGTSQCLQDDAGLSKDCADCYGDVTQCGFDNCVVVCGADSASQACRDCVSENCDAAFGECTGTPDCGAGGSGGAGGAGGVGGGG
jgi:hypothetical protein